MAASNSSNAHSPIEQFEIKPLIDIHFGALDVSFTNSALFMVITVLAASLLMVMGSSGRALVPSRLQSITELLYEFISNTLLSITGPAGQKYFPFIFSLFIFILFANTLGMIPYSFTVTSHIAVTGALAVVIFVAVTIIGFHHHGIGFLRLFVPRGVPLPLLLFLVPIEVISYLIRPFTLSLRLFANMMAGHIMLKVFAGFVISLGVLGVIPLAAMLGIIALEFLVAALQAYVFIILTCVYLNDALNMHD